MSNFPLETRVELNSGHENLQVSRPFYHSGETEIEELLDGFLFRHDVEQISPFLSSFSRFWTSAIEMLNEGDYSLLSLL